MFRIDLRAGAAALAVAGGAPVAAQYIVLPESQPISFTRAAAPSTYHLIRDKDLAKAAGITTDQASKLELLYGVQRDEYRRLHQIVAKAGTVEGDKAVAAAFDAAEYLDHDRLEQAFLEHALDEKQRKTIEEWQIGTAGALAPFHPRFRTRFGTTDKQFNAYHARWQPEVSRVQLLPDATAQLAAARAVAEAELTEPQKTALRALPVPPAAIREQMAGWLKWDEPYHWHIDEACFVVSMFGGASNVLDCAAARSFAGLTPGETEELRGLREEHRKLLYRLCEFQGTIPPGRIACFTPASSLMAWERRTAERLFSKVDDAKALKLQAVLLQAGTTAHIFNGMMLGVQLTELEKRPLRATPEKPYGDWEKTRMALSPTQRAIHDRIRAVSVPEEVVEAYRKRSVNPRLAWEK